MKFDIIPENEGKLFLRKGELYRLKHTCLQPTAIFEKADGSLNGLTATAAEFGDFELLVPISEIKAFKLRRRPRKALREIGVTDMISTCQGTSVAAGANQQKEGEA